MTAFTTPELIQPGELYIPDGKVGYSTIAGALPNGDDAFRISEVAGTENFQAYQDSIAAGAAARAPHLLTDAACALSFWIRRNQNFDAVWSGLPAGSVSAAQLNTNFRFIMGVVDPLTASLPFPLDRRVSWAILPYSVDRIQMMMQGWRTDAPGYNWQSSSPILLATGAWTLVVINREPAGFSSTLDPAATGRFAVFVDGNIEGGYGYSNWMLLPNPLNDQRFCLGDGTTLARTAGGAAGGSAWDIAKVCFHNQNLSAGDQLDMIDSMRYGPGL